MGSVALNPRAPSSLNQPEPMIVWVPNMKPYIEVMGSLPKDSGFWLVKDDFRRSLQSSIQPQGACDFMVFPFQGLLKRQLSEPGACRRSFGPG